MVQNLTILHDNAKSHTAAAVTDLLHRCQLDILEHPPYSPDMSPCDYDLFAKVKEPLRGTRYNTRNELIRAIGRSIRKINKDGRDDGVRSLPNSWQKEINKGEATILKVHKCCTLWIKPCQKYRTVAITFYPTLVYCNTPLAYFLYSVSLYTKFRSNGYSHT